MGISSRPIERSAASGWPTIGFAMTAFNRRYALRLGSVSIGNASVDAWMVIVTDEVPHAEVLARGFQEIPQELSDDEVRARYGVKQIYVVRDDRRTKVVN